MNGSVETATARSAATGTARVVAEQRRKQVFQEFEGIFAAQLAREMQATVKESGLFGEMPGAGIYENLIESVMADVLARNGALGIARVLERTYQSRIAAAAAGATGEFGDEAVRQPSMESTDSSAVVRIRSTGVSND